MSYNLNDKLELFINGAIGALETVQSPPGFMRGIYEGRRELYGQIRYYAGIYSNKKDLWHEIYIFVFDNYNSYIPDSIHDKYIDGYKSFYKIVLKFFAEETCTFFLEKE